MVDPDTFRVWQALQPDALPPGVRRAENDGGKDMLPEINYHSEKPVDNSDVLAQRMWHNTALDDAGLEHTRGNLNTKIHFEHELD